jgi:uncharacterized protein YyaL (SSP411 family)
MIPGGRLLRTWKDGHARLLGYLEDYAGMADGLLAAYEATFEARYLQAAVNLARSMIDLFWEEGEGAFYDTGNDHEALVTRPRDLFDNATPSGTSMAVDALLRLGTLTGEERFERIATDVLRRSLTFVERAPSAFGRLLCALDFYLGPRKELALVWPSGGDPSPLLEVVFHAFRPRVVVAGTLSDDGISQATPLLEARSARDGQPTAYVCQQFVCQAPTTEPSELALQLT